MPNFIVKFEEEAGVKLVKVALDSRSTLTPEKPASHGVKL